MSQYKCNTNILSSLIFMSCSSAQVLLLPQIQTLWLINILYMLRKKGRLLPVNQARTGFCHETSDFWCVRCLCTCVCATGIRGPHLNQICWGHCRAPLVFCFYTVGPKHCWSHLMHPNIDSDSAPSLHPPQALFPVSRILSYKVTSVPYRENITYLYEWPYLSCGNIHWVWPHCWIWTPKICFLNAAQHVFYIHSQMWNQESHSVAEESGLGSRCLSQHHYTRSLKCRRTKVSPVVYLYFIFLPLQ